MCCAIDARHQQHYSDEGRGFVHSGYARSPCVPGVSWIRLLFTLMPAQLPFFLQDLTAGTACQSGLAISETTLSYALVSMAYGHVGSRLDQTTVLSVDFALIDVGYLLTWLAGGWALILLGLLLAGTGQGLPIPDLSVWPADETRARSRVRGLGGLKTALSLGVFISPLVGPPLNAAVGFRGLCLIAGALLLATAALFWMWRDGVPSLPRRGPSEVVIPDLAPGGGPQSLGWRAKVPATHDWANGGPVLF